MANLKEAAEAANRRADEKERLAATAQHRASEAEVPNRAAATRRRTASACSLLSPQANECGWRRWRQMDRERAQKQAAEARKLLQAAEERREADLEKARNEAKEALHLAVRFASPAPSCL